MFDDFDLDVNNYSINDIAKLLKLDPTKNYRPNEVKMRELEIVSEIMRTSEIENRLKSSVVQFFDNIKDIYIKFKCRSDEPEVPLRSIAPDRINYPLSKEPTSRTEEVVTRKVNDFVYTQNSDYFTGTINPLNKRTLKKCLTIDSKFRENLESTKSQNFVVHLRDRLTKVVSMELSAFEFPVCFYGTSASYGNNFLNIGVDISGVSQTVWGTIVIPDGNYNAFDLVKIINVLMGSYNNTVDPDYAANSPYYYIFSYIQLTLDLTSDTNSGSGKITIAPNPSPVSQPNGYVPTATDITYANSIKAIILDFSTDINRMPNSDHISTRLGWNLGFTQKIYKGSSIYTADTVIEPSSMRYFFLSIND